MSMRERLVTMARLAANANAVYTGLGTESDWQVMRNCRHQFVTPAYVHTLIFTRDGGMHTCGWWKNPDYERCFHLSVSFIDRKSGEIAPQDHEQARRWCELFYGDHTRYIWAEPPFSETGHVRDIWHYRVFVAEDWQTPILPRGEVYSRKFTELGWKSWSDLHPDKPQESAHT